MNTFGKALNRDHMHPADALLDRNYDRLKKKFAYRPKGLTESITVKNRFSPKFASNNLPGINTTGMGKNFQEIFQTYSNEINSMDLDDLLHLASGERLHKRMARVRRPKTAPAHPPLDPIMATPLTYTHRGFYKDIVQEKLATISSQEILRNDMLKHEHKVMMEQPRTTLFSQVISNSAKPVTHNPWDSKRTTNQNHMERRSNIKTRPIAVEHSVAKKPAAAIQKSRKTIQVGKVDPRGKVESPKPKRKIGKLDADTKISPLDISNIGTPIGSKSEHESGTTESSDTMDQRKAHRTSQLDKSGDESKESECQLPMESKSEESSDKADSDQHKSHSSKTSESENKTHSELEVSSEKGDRTKIHSVKSKRGKILHSESSDIATKKVESKPTQKLLDKESRSQTAPVSKTDLSCDVDDSDQSKSQIIKGKGSKILHAKLSEISNKRNESKQDRNKAIALQESKTKSEVSSGKGDTDRPKSHPLKDKGRALYEKASKISNKRVESKPIVTKKLVDKDIETSHFKLSRCQNLTDLAIQPPGIIISVSSEVLYPSPTNDKSTSTIQNQVAHKSEGITLKEFRSNQIATHLSNLTIERQDSASVEPTPKPDVVDNATSDVTLPKKPTVVDQFTNPCYKEIRKWEIAEQWAQLSVKPPELKYVSSAEFVSTTTSARIELVDQCQQSNYYEENDLSKDTSFKLFSSETATLGTASSNELLSKSRYTSKKDAIQMKSWHASREPLVALALGARKRVFALKDKLWRKLTTKVRNSTKVASSVEMSAGDCAMSTAHSLGRRRSLEGLSKRLAFTDLRKGSPPLNTFYYLFTSVEGRIRRINANA